MSALNARSAIIGASVLAAFHAVDGQRPRVTIGQLDHAVWSVRDGAPSYVTALAQSADRVLWIGNNVGLYRFDGVRFERFEPSLPQSFPARAINEIRAMPDSSLWIGFFSGGVSVVRRDRVVNYSTRDGIPEGRINGVARDSAGDTWISSMTGLARQHDGRWQLMGREERYPGGNTGSIFVDRRGALWAPTPVGVYVLPRGAHQFVRQAPSPDPTEGGTRTPVEGPDGSVWGASFALGLTRLSDSAGRPTPSRSAVKGLGRSAKSYVDREGNAWIVTFGSGLVRVALPTNIEQSRATGGMPRQPAIEHVPLVTSQNASVLLEDREGNIWVGTQGGLERFRETALTPVVLPKDILWPVLAPAVDGSIWLASNRRPVSVLTDELHTLGNAPSLISCAYRDLEGSFWFGGSRGLWHVLPSGSPMRARFTTVALPPGSESGAILAITRTLEGDLWVSFWSPQTLHGVFRRRNGVWSLVHLPPSFMSLPMLALVADSAGRVWLGYTNRLVLISGDSTRVFSDTVGLQVGVVTALTVKGPRLWIGGKTGLTMMEGERFHAIAANPAIRDVTGIVETANGDVWLNGTDGVLHIAAVEVHRALQDHAYRVRADHFDEHDGLHGEPVQVVPRPTAIQSADGRLWFTASVGVAWIDPSNSRQNRLSPPVQIRRVTAAGKSYDVAHRLALPVRTSQLQITYTALEFARPDRIRFRYRLTNVDTAWVEAETRREAFYTNLGPGSYRFRVIAANEDGVWNDAGASIDFDIPPSFTQTKTFVGLIVAAIALALVAAGWLLAWWRQRQNARALHAKFEGQLAERARVARELHDTLLGDMTGVALQLKAAAHRANTPSGNGEIVDLLSSLSTQVQRTMIEARRSVTAIRTTPDRDLPLHQQLERAAHRTFDETGITVRISHLGSPRTYSPTVESQVVGIAMEAMANARRHAECRSVEISCSYAPRELRIRLRDDGRGFDASQAEPSGHWGLVGMRERAASIGASLTLTSMPGRGTDVLLIAPHT